METAPPSIERLRYEISQQERLVSELRRQQVQRHALIARIHELMCAAEPQLFATLNSDVREMLASIAEHTVREELSSSGLSSSDSATNMFSKEMEERIMQEEEPLFGKQLLQQEDRPDGAKRTRGGQGNKRRHKGKRNKLCISLSPAEENARAALLAAVDALQLGEIPPPVDSVPLWLTDEEGGGEATGAEHDPMEKEQEAEGAEQYYSDDFEELSDEELADAAN
ncbi:hypothetical protein ERJ75_001013800 [Trypanosoma vivax]|uniref:Uncharacterized protein n=1 Tax=Trypanosoma vivax (strain Y486) TaxID=1055687 RepID=G0U268_TRYVY|nr:hypothetical protein TRVL_07220 [Trypanosoma vivax]KAH8611674.1 hypothetical protein ERJ75_001013800 [Trypanosoma vivax]CCC50371.1 conserved hypothetical protein [Trypanosoma vivax Y486]